MAAEARITAFVMFTCNPSFNQKVIRAESIPRRTGKVAVVMVPKFALVFAQFEKFNRNSVLGFPGWSGSKH